MPRSSGVALAPTGRRPEVIKPLNPLNTQAGLPPNDTLPLLLTVKQACNELQIGRSQLHGLCQAGTIRTVKIGARGVRIPRDEVFRFITDGLRGERHV